MILCCLALATGALAACSGANAVVSTPPATPAPVASVLPASALVQTSFVLQNAVLASSSTARVPQYLGAGAVSIAVTLVSVNGAAPRSTMPLTVNQPIAPAQCPCTVAGPPSPIGNDVFAFTTYDGPNATGKAIASTTFASSIAAGQITSGSLSLVGVTTTLALTVPSGAVAGTASSATLGVTVKDGDGNVVTGSYAAPVTVGNSDTSGAQGSMLVVNGGTPASSVTVTKSTDVVTLAYHGLAIAPATISAAASGTPTVSAAFAPTLSPIVYTGALNGTTPQIAVFDSTGTGSTATFAVGEHGLTDAPYNRTLTATAGSACATIGTVSPASGTTFTLTSVAAPAIGTCVITVSDGLGQTKAVNGISLPATPIGIQ